VEVGTVKKVPAKMAKKSVVGRVAVPSVDATVYRRLALALSGAMESSHMGAPDFRVDGRIFATLAYGSRGLGTLKLSVEQQAEFIAESPEWFEPAAGGWGRMGMTLVRLDAPENMLAGALETAFRNVIAKQAETKRAGKGKSAASRI
jgi:hypothetical protein